MIGSQNIAGSETTDTVNQTFDLVNSLLTLQETGGTITTDGNEQNLYIVDNPYAGSMKPQVCYVDLDLMVGGDTVVFNTYYRLALAGGWELQDVATYIGADGGLAGGRTIIAVDMLPCRFGIRLTIQRTAGGDHAFVYSVLEES